MTDDQFSVLIRAASGETELELREAVAAAVKEIEHYRTHTEGHGKPCYYCGELCSAIAGNPAKWPIPLCHADEPGVVKWHHEACMMRRLEFYDTLITALNGLHDVVRQLGGPIESVPRDKAVDAFITTYCNMRQQLESERRYVESRARRLVPNAEPGRSFGLLMDDIESEIEKLRRDLVERDRAVFRCLESVAHTLGAGKTPQAETEGFNDGSSYGIDHHDV